MDLVVILGRNVRRLREEAGLSQEQLAFDAGMKRSYLSDLERGVRNPSVKAMARLAEALSADPRALLDPLQRP
ncbi:MAG: helix-turn-helix domain-containing protein [Brevundimonas sp.]|uniref:helix-turn-helix domain-containing protein n=1 Tax=Brevundimonas sp. TaxID=1871086 RepID=UPI00391C968E